MLLIEFIFPELCKSDVSRYGYLEVFQRVPWNLRYRESTVFRQTGLSKLETQIRCH